MEVGGPQVNDAGHSGTADRDDYIHVGRSYQPASVHIGSSDYDRVLEQQCAEDKALAVYRLSVRALV